jgi:hypothetical protein
MMREIAVGYERLARRFEQRVRRADEEWGGRLSKLATVNFLLCRKLHARLGVELRGCHRSALVRFHGPRTIQTLASGLHKFAPVVRLS